MEGSVFKVGDAKVEGEEGEDVVAACWNGEEEEEGEGSNASLCSWVSRSFLPFVPPTYTSSFPSPHAATSSS